VGFDGARTLTDAETELFAALRFPIAEWQNLQSTFEVQRRDLEAAKVELESAEAAYSQAAPFGPVSKWFMEDADRQDADRLQKASDNSRIRYQASETSCRATEQRLASLSDVYLRSCLTSDVSHLPRSPLASIVDSIVNRTATLSTEVWNEHRLKQSELISNVACTCRMLQEFYETGQANASGGISR
jgi:hypothetical protein